MKLSLLILVCLSLLSSREITLKELDGYPKSIAKDFYIWQFLTQKKVSQKEAKTAFKQVYRKSQKIKKVYFKKVKKTKKKKILNKCKNISTKKLAKHKNLECVKKSLTSLKAVLLKPDDLKILIDRMKGVDKDKELLLKALYFKQPIEKTLYLKPSLFYNLFFYATKSFRTGKRINKELNYGFINRLTYDKKRFSKFVNRVLSYDSYAPLQKALLKVNPSDKIEVSTLFKIGFHFVANKKINESKRFFRIAKKNTSSQPLKDKANFWLYLLTKHDKYLKELDKSWDINIYTLYAKEILKKKFDESILSNFNFAKYDDLFKPKMNPSNPFDWLKTKQIIKKMQQDKKSKEKLLNFANLFKTDEHKGVYSVILEKAYKFKKQSFPMPYKDSLKTLSIKDKALIYALARQESRFIPSSISSSFALGMMQIMPFLVKDIAKRKKEKIELENMFNPRKNLEYAIFHIKDLKKQFISPVFIAYAYNGGGGFTRRILKKGELFTKGKYEPFLSIERLPYYESRRYGKKVLANYVIYRQLLGKPVSIHKLFKELLIPSKSDYIRKK